MANFQICQIQFTKPAHAGKDPENHKTIHNKNDKICFFCRGYYMNRLHVVSVTNGRLAGEQNNHEGLTSPPNIFWIRP